jgi:hypothetical protein
MASRAFHEVVVLGGIAVLERHHGKSCARLQCVEDDRIQVFVAEAEPYGHQQGVLACGEHAREAVEHRGVRLTPRLVVLVKRGQD